jgi:ubiquinone/menaquinone biosynthesis C-methylase UbiE
VSEHSSDLIEHFSALLIREGGYTKRDFAGGYDAYRPTPPAVLLDLLCLEAQVERPSVVVDLGSGTGLSTRAWADRAGEVVGIEASAEMRARAEQETAASNVRYVHAFAQETGLPDGMADVVTCSQSLHWMEPEPTFAEVARILRPGGVFAAYDYDWPPLCHWEVERAFTEMMRRVNEARKGSGRPPWTGRPRYDKPQHLERIQASGRFRYAREIGLHNRVRGDADRIVGMALSLGPLVVLLDGGKSEEDLGLTQLREAAARTLGDRESDWFMSYRVRLAVK